MVPSYPSTKANYQVARHKHGLCGPGLLACLERICQKVLQLHHPFPPLLESASHIEPGHPYQFRFAFIVPQRLLPVVYTHDKKGPCLTQSHTLLPPSLINELGPMSPDTCCIAYQICVNVLQAIWWLPRISGEGQKKDLDYPSR